MQRLESALKRWSGVAPGLPALRAILAFVVVILQSAEVSESWPAVMATPLWLVQALSLPALFVATGFFLSRSRRLSPRRAFLRRRGRRVFPVVVLTITLTALLLGPLLTTYSLRNYLSDPGSWSYFANLLAYPIYALPGLFEFNNDAAVVNAITAIFPIYVLLVAIATATPTDDRRAAAILIVVTLLLTLGSVAVRVFDALPAERGSIFRALLAGQGLGMLLAGLLGMLADRMRSRVKLGFSLLSGAALALGIVALLGKSGWTEQPLFWILTTPILAFFVLSIVMTPLPLPRIAVRVQPVLLPILLSAYPLQQAVIDRGPRGQPFYLNFTLSAVPLLLVGALSWWLASWRSDRASGPSQVELVADSLLVRPSRSRRSVRSRLSDMMMPFLLITAVGLGMILAMGMLFLAATR